MILLFKLLTRSKKVPSTTMMTLFSMRSFSVSLFLFLLVASMDTALAEDEIMSGHTVFNNYKNPLPHTYITPHQLPDEFNWGSVNGRSYITRSLNQHIPQYCGSCWAHSALSSLADRIKIARPEQTGDEINLSIQYLLNCAGTAGSCHGGSATGAYEFIKENGFIPYDS
jgi:cathepsin X